MTTKNIITGDNGKLVPLDDYNGALVIFDGFHYSVHEGRAYRANKTTTALANNASLELLIHTPASLSTHSFFDSALDGDFEMKLFETPSTVAATGTILAVYNQHRRAQVSSGYNTSVSVFHTPSVTNVGSTELFNFYRAGGKTGVGNQISLSEMWVLESDTWYLHQLKNISGSPAIGYLGFEFAELPWPH